VRYSTSCRYVSFLAALAAPFIAGCGGGDGPRLAPVEGTVTLDGQPLAGASVVFQPEHGRPSVGETDDAGRYKLDYTRDKPGAMLGKHRVSISTFREADPDADDPAHRKGQPERVPAKYNVETTLEVEVTAGRKEPIDFPLDSKGEVRPPDQ
jgi:hypothetical protein